MSEFAEKVFVGSTLLGEFIADNNTHFSGDTRGIIKGEVVEERPVQVIFPKGDWLEEQYKFIFKIRGVDCFEVQYDRIRFGCVVLQRSLRRCGYCEPWGRKI